MAPEKDRTYEYIAADSNDSPGFKLVPVALTSNVWPRFSAQAPDDQAVIFYAADGIFDDFCLCHRLSTTIELNKNLQGPMMLPKTIEL